MDQLQMKGAIASFWKRDWFQWALSPCIYMVVLVADGTTTDSEPKGSWHS